MSCHLGAQNTLSDLQTLINSLIIFKMCVAMRNILQIPSPYQNICKSVKIICNYKSAGKRIFQGFLQQTSFHKAQKTKIKTFFSKTYFTSH